MDKHTPGQRRKNMRAVKNKGSQIETALCKELWRRGLRYRKNYTKVYGKPDIVFVGKKVAIFCDSEFWHGFSWEERKNDIKSRRECCNNFPTHCLIKCTTHDFVDGV